MNEDKTKYNVCLTNYKGDSNNEIDDINEVTNHSKNNDKNSTQYVITAHHSNKFFIYFLMAYDIF